MTETAASKTDDMSDRNPAHERGRRPVFVIGCHRSGTNLLYDTLLSAGDFAIYRGYLPIHKMLIPRFGHPSNLASRRKIVEAFLASKSFPRTGLQASDLSSELLAHGQTGGDFLRIVMGKIAAQQDARRWAVYDPDNVLHIPRIRRDIPDALFVHIIRDGRDVALSLAKMGGFRPFSWNRQPRGLIDCALYWQWMVRAGKHHGKLIPQDYIEVHYEDLVTQPHSTLDKLGRFLDQDLNYDRIQRAGLGRLRESNSSFLEEDPSSTEHPVQRWKERLSAPEVADLESLIGPCLQECGYELTIVPGHSPSLRLQLLAAAYPRFLNAKLWVRLHTLLGRLSDLSALEFTDPPESR
jgi:hypothetical protein